jgi:hypothetical protein
MKLERIESLNRRLGLSRLWTAVAKRSGDTALASCGAANESGVALRFPPQSKTLRAALTVALLSACIVLAGEVTDPPAAMQPAKRKPVAKSKPSLEFLHGHFAHAKTDRRFDSAEAMHADHFHLFQTAPGFGMSRILVMPSTSELTLAYDTYRVPKPDLIALEGEPFAYRSPGMEMVSMASLTNRTIRARLQTRELTALETKAIASLREGRNLVVQPAKLRLPTPQDEKREVDGLVAVGALRAKAVCAKCHEVKEGTLLGAFSYSLFPSTALAAQTVPNAAEPESR